MSSKNEFIELLPAKSKVAYGGANTASSILSGIGFAAITFYYNVKLGLSAELIGIAWLIFAVWNAINDPLLMIGLPPFVTACTGMDALTHCLIQHSHRRLGYIYLYKHG